MNRRLPARGPGVARVHADAFGHLHVCQGILIGSLSDLSLRQICAGYDSGAHPVVGPLLEGGPAALVRRYHLPHGERYADACHLCYEARLALRERFPDTLAPQPDVRRSFLMRRQPPWVMRPHSIRLLSSGKGSGACLQRG